ncbi:hypothetical protein HZC21_04865 [Candidatus Peregrinibacteria bacterium]|nr:hypothetical protein [Candidatus Peregrinibacteria bacterium]
MAPPDFVPPSETLNKLRENLDTADKIKDDKVYKNKLEKDNADFLAQLKYMLKKPSNVEETGYADIIFQAIDKTADGTVSKMDILKLLEVPNIKEITTPYNPTESYPVESPIDKNGHQIMIALHKTGSQLTNELFPHTRFKESSIKEYPVNANNLTDEDYYKIYRSYYTEGTIYYVKGLHKTETPRTRYL